MIAKEINLENFDELWPEPSFEEVVANSKIIRQTLYSLQDGNGVDVTLIWENLRLTPEQRSEQAYQFARGMIRDRANVKRVG